MSWGCVLAGGQSRRMGRDKALLPWRGKPLIAHAVERLRAAGLEPVIAGARPELGVYAPVVSDRFQGAGPLAGMEAVLAELGGDAPVVFTAVDLPLLPAAFVRLLAERAERSGARATVPFAGGAPQPLCAAYRTTLAGGLRAALAREDRKIMRVMRALAAGVGERDFFRVEALAAADHAPGAAHGWWTNLNSPPDLERLGSTTLEGQ